MGIQLNGNGTVSGIAVGGLPDGIIQTADIASGVLHSHSGSLKVLEQFYSPCDGSVMPTNKGNITLGTVTEKQAMSTSIVAVEGSSLTYEPPAGTVQVIYEFVMHMSFYNTNPVISIYAYLDGTQITDAFTAQAGSYRDDRLSWKWGFNIGGDDNNATGRRANWNSARTIELKAREYGSSNQGNLHSTSYSANTGTDVFVRPCIGITAIGTIS